MDVFPAQIIVRNGIVRVYGAAVLHVLENLILQRLALHVRHHTSANLTLIAVKHSDYDCLTRSAASVTGLSRETCAAIPVHVLELAADESLIDFHAAAILAAKFIV